MPLLKPREWKIGDFLLLKISAQVAGLAHVSGDYFLSEEKLWENGAFPFRVPVEFDVVLPVKQRILFKERIKPLVVSSWGPRYGVRILNKDILEGSIAGQIIAEVKLGSK